MALIYNQPGDNLIAAITPTVVDGTVASESSVDNLVDGSPAKALIFTTTHCRLVWDLASAIAAPAFWLHHTNLTGTVKFEAHTANSWGAPDISTTMPVSTVDGDGFWPDLFLDRSALAAKRYVSLVVTGNVAPIVIGETWLGAIQRTMPAVGGIRPDVTIPQGGQTVIHETNYGVELAYRRGNRTGGVTGQIKTDGLTGLPAVQAWAQAAAWRAKPWPVVVNAPVPIVAFMKWAQDSLEPQYEATKDGHQVVTIPFAWTLVSRGTPW